MSAQRTIAKLREENANLRRDLDHQRLRAIVAEVRVEANEALWASSGWRRDGSPR